MFAFALIGAVSAAAAYAYLKGHTSEVVYLRSEVDGNMYLVQKNGSSQEAANILGKINMDVQALIRHLLKKYPDDPRYRRIAQNWDPSAVSEGSVSSGYTSYSVNKGERVVLCLTTDDPKEFASPNVVTYVTLHEIAHLGDDAVGHGSSYWTLFADLLKEAIEINIYKKEDFASNPQSFCGITVDSSII